MRQPLFFLLTLCLTARIFAADNSTSLAGEWRFALDRNDAGVNENWFAKNLRDRIQLPGILQAQGYGDDISTNTPWVLTLGEAWWEIQPTALREHFSQPGHVEVPFLAQPPKHYVGAAWYQRDVEIPLDWNGRRVTLFLERAHWKSTVWLDDKKIGSDSSLCTSEAFDFGIIAPGKHHLTICVDNRMQLPTAHHQLDAHSVSDALGASWNGIVGKIELRSTPPVWIDDVQVFPNVEKKAVRLHAILHNVSGEKAEGKISYFFAEPLNGLPSSENFNTDATNSILDEEFNLGDNAKTWDEFSPALCKLRINVRSIIGGEVFEDETEAIFGLRQISTRDKDIFINGKPVNLRLTHFGGDFPLTGYPAMDAESWKTIFQTCKTYGLNGMRFHSWCPPEAAFKAADELGFYLQPECGLWADFGNAETREFLTNETARILKAYGNHPSFILLSPSNEPKNYQHFTPEWASENYREDPRRLYSAGTGWSDPTQIAPGGAQYATLVRFGGGQMRNAPGWFGRDYREALENIHIPVLAHEVGQWCAYPDFDVIKKFTGYLQPGNYNIFKYIAAQNGVLDEDKDFAKASGEFQLECYKEDIEANLRTPGLAGFQLLDLHDYLGQGTALIGVLDAFWESKGYAPLEEFRKFCGPVVPLARLTNRVFTTADKFDVPVEIYNFGGTILRNAACCWEIRDADRNLLAQGDFTPATIPPGKNFPLGNASLELSHLPAPGRYKFAVRIRNMPFGNDWNFWLFPAQVADSKTADVLITAHFEEAENALAAGSKVLFMPTDANLDSKKCPPMKSVPIFWNIQMTVRPPQNRRPRFDAFLGLFCETGSPALAEFPTDDNCDWQWTPIINNVRAVNLAAAPRELRPIVWSIDDWNRDWKLGVIFECRVGTGKLLVSAIDLNNDRSAEVKQLRRSLLDYMGGEKFQPATTLTPEQAGAIFSVGKNSLAEPARVFDPDLNDGSIPTPKK